MNLPGQGRVVFSVINFFFLQLLHIYSYYLVRTAEFCYLITFWLLKFAQAVTVLIFFLCIISYNQSRDLFGNLENVGQRVHFCCI